MQTKIRKLDGLPIEEPVLDEAGQEKQQQLARVVMEAYREEGTLTGQTVREEVEKYQTEIVGHVVK